MILHLHPAVWVIGIATLWILGVGYALALGTIADRADRQAARMYAEQCPDELEGGQ
jgi:hypothetical protein